MIMTTMMMMVMMTMTTILCRFQVNDANIEVFQQWVQAYPHVRLVSDHSTSNSTRLGAVACIDLAVRHFDVAGTNILVIAG